MDASWGPAAETVDRVVSRYKERARAGNDLALLFSEIHAFYDVIVQDIANLAYVADNQPEIRRDLLGQVDVFHQLLGESRTQGPTGAGAELVQVLELTRRTSLDVLEPPEACVSGRDTRGLEQLASDLESFK